MAQFLRHFYFSMRGRISRRFYWQFGVIPFVIAGAVLEFALSAAQRSMSESQLGVFAGVVVFFTLWISIALLAKRLHDVGLSAWWMVGICLVAFTMAYLVSQRAGSLSSLVMWTLLGLIPGTRGRNRFGPDPIGGDQEIKQSDVPAA